MNWHTHTQSSFVFFISFYPSFSIQVFPLTSCISLQPLLSSGLSVSLLLASMLPPSLVCLAVSTKSHPFFCKRGKHFHKLSDATGAKVKQVCASFWCDFFDLVNLLECCTLRRARVMSQRKCFAHARTPHTPPTHPPTHAFVMFSVANLVLLL